MHQFCSITGDRCTLLITFVWRHASVGNKNFPAWKKKTTYVAYESKHILMYSKVGLISQLFQNREQYDDWPQTLQADMRVKVRVHHFVSNLGKELSLVIN